MLLVAEAKRARCGGRLELERQCQEEEARRRDLPAQAERWVTSQQLQRDLDAVEHTATKRGDGRVPTSEQQRWLAWARRCVGELNPLKSEVRVRS